MYLDIDDLPEELTISVYPHMTQFGSLNISDTDLGEDSYYTLIGEPVEVTLKLMKRDKVVDGVVANLKAEAQKVMADAQVKCNQIDEKIQSLLALPNLGENNENE